MRLEKVMKETWKMQPAGLLQRLGGGPGGELVVTWESADLDSKTMVLHWFLLVFVGFGTDCPRGATIQQDQFTID